MALGVVDLPERARRTLPSLFVKSMMFFGLKEGPNPATRSQLDYELLPMAAISLTF